MDHSYTYKYHTSYRTRSIEETLHHAKAYAKRLGISRVTESTYLDNIGVPVFAGIRPVAVKGSLCVASGKGLRPEEAQAGAYMEAIEQAMAEPEKAGLEIIEALPKQILDGATRPESILDFCPLSGKEIFADQAMACVWADDIATKERLLVPAQLVFVPFRSTPNLSAPFHSSTNGLCSGNSLVEAQIHGILEVIERDVASFLHFNDTAVFIHPNTYSPELQAIAEKVNAAGLELILRYSQNEFGTPWFMSAVIDTDREDPLFFDVGQGCHIDKNIAAIRAVTEAIQSRMVIIHGGRDDMDKFHSKYENMTYDERRNHFHQKLIGWRDDRGALGFDEIVQPPIAFENLTELRDQLIAMLAEKGFSRVLNISFTETDEPLQVCKIIIPGLENFSMDCHAMGPRLAAHASKYYDQTFRRT